jgi:hypothetical protein
MTSRESMIYLLWYGEQAIAGDTPSEEEFAMFKEAREVSKGMAHRLMRIKPEDYAYTSGEPFD